MNYYAYILSIPFIALLAMASCKSSRSVEEDITSVKNVDVKGSYLDSMATQRHFSFDELDYWLFKPNSGWLINVADSASVPRHAVHVRVKGGQISTQTETQTKTSADCKSAEVDETKSITKTSVTQYTCFNYFMAGIMLILLIMFIIRIRSPRQ